MPRKVKPFNADDVVQRYLSGEPLQKIAPKLGMGVPKLKELLRSRGVDLRAKADALRLEGKKRRLYAPAAAIEAFKAGSTVEKVALDFGISENLVRRTLLRSGLKPRSRSEALAARMSAASIEERRSITAKARAVARSSGCLYTPNVIAQAQANRANTLAGTEWQIGSGEALLVGFLRSVGLAPEPQFPVYKYNIDMTIHPIAVEVHRAANNPMTDLRLRRRTVNLFNRGWFVLYVWVTPAHPIQVGAAEKAAAFFQLTQSNESRRRECRVIRGSGEYVATYRLNPDDGSLIKSTVDLSDSDG